MSNKSVAEINATVESKISVADTGKRSIFTGDMSIAQSATEALKQHLARNVELLSCMNALLFPQPGANHAMEFSRYAPRACSCCCVPQNLIRRCIKSQPVPTSTISHSHSLAPFSGSTRPPVQQTSRLRTTKASPCGKQAQPLEQPRI
jgi:hypothetical protein